MQKLFMAVLVSALSLPAAWASDAHHHANASSDATNPPETAGLGANEGEIRKVDREQGKLTIKHGPLPEVDMPNMTMVFRVQDPAMLDQAAVGDKVKLQVEKRNGVLIVTGLSKP